MGINLVLGNLFSILAMITDSISSSRKTAKGVLMVQTVSQVFYGIGTVILGGYSGAVQNAVSIFRNLEATRKRPNKYIKWLLIAMGVVFGFYFNNLGVIGWLPVIANLMYSLAVFYFKDNQRALKTVFAVNIVMFAVFNVVILNVVGTIANTVVFITTVSFIIKDIKNSDKKNGD